MTLFRLFELLLFCCTNLVPGLVLTCIACKKILRFKLVPTLFLSLGTLFVYYLSTVFYEINFLSYVAANFIINAGYLLFALLLTTHHTGQILFILGITLNYGSVCGITSEGLYHLFQLSDVRFGYLSSLMTLFVSIAFFVPYYNILIRRFIPIFERNETQKSWNYLWLVPAFFCLIHYYCIWCEQGEYAHDFLNVGFLILINAGSLLLSFLIAYLVEENAIRQRLESENLVYAIQELHFKDQQLNYEKTRRARHDLRQHLRLIQSYLDSGDLTFLQDYIKSYAQSLPEPHERQYCDNQIANTMINYYAGVAKESGIRFEASLVLPASVQIEAPDLCVLFGNLLENSVDACKRSKKISEDTSDSGHPAFVCIHTRMSNSKTCIITVDNGPCEQPVSSFNTQVKESIYLFRSSKENRLGIGTASIRNIVAKYNGTSSFTWENGVFKVSLILSLPCQ